MSSVSKEKEENQEQVLLESEIPEQMILEHPNYKELEEKLLQAEQKAQDNWNGWLTAQADLENFKKRTERDIANSHKYALEKIGFELLTTVDNLERSLVSKVETNDEFKSFHEGVDLILKSLLETLEKFDIKPIDPLGEVFNPEYHTAITTREDEKAESNVIVEVIQKGYWLKDRLLRPALVVVVK